MKDKSKLICFDSDGCVMDSMTVKHERCFGPALFRVWEFKEDQEEILEYWNACNLYSRSRGINRFLGLQKVLERFRPLKKGSYPNLEPLQRWVENTLELSNASLVRELEKSKADILSMALQWSEEVNRSIERLPRQSCSPFPYAAQGVEQACRQADVTVVSSANRSALESEWTHYGLIPYVDELMAQESGSKAVCIRKLKERGYEPEQILMVGDAVGDLHAALENEVLFYPILAGCEVQSWQRFGKQILPLFLAGSYQGAEMEEQKKYFLENLKEDI